MTTIIYIALWLAVVVSATGIVYFAVLFAKLTKHPKNIKSNQNNECTSDSTDKDKKG